MTGPSPSALITDQGQHILLRIQGAQYNVSQDELRSVLGLPSGPPGLGISIDCNCFRFEFGDDQTIELTAEQLQHRLAKQLTRET